MNEITFRDYQIEAIGNTFIKLDANPAGPADNEIVSYCRSHRARQNGDNGWDSETLAQGQDTGPESSV